MHRSTRAFIAAALLAAGLVSTTAHAQRADVQAAIRVGPPRGAFVAAIPGGAAHYAWNGGHYWYHGGTWYRPQGGRFIVIAPPIGIVVPVLPPDYSLRWYGGAQYYYADGAYYTSSPGQGYVVVAPPPGAEVAPDGPNAVAQQDDSSPYGPPPPPGSVAPAAPVAPSTQPAPYAPAAPTAPATRPAPYAPATQPLRSGEPIVYPRNGQSPQATQADRDACAQWATQQSAGNSGRSVYLRAFDACMDGRGYTVR